MQPLTTKERARLDELESQIKLHREQERSAVFEAGNALIEIRESKLYREDGTFEEYCKLRWNWSARHAYRVCEATEFRNGQLLLSETSDEEVHVPKSEREARKLKSANVTQCRNAENKTETFKQNLSKPVSAKLVPDADIAYSEPPPMPLTFRQEVAELVKLLDGLLMGEGGFACSQKFRHAVALAKKIQHEVQAELPGMSEQFQKKFKPPTEADVISFCATVGLTTQDAEYFYGTKNGCNWTNKGMSMHDWQGTVRAWKAAGHFPSQKVVNGYGHAVPKEKTLAQKQAERTRREVERL